MQALSTLIPALPLISALLLWAGQSSLSKGLAAAIATLSVFVSFTLTAVVFFSCSGGDLPLLVDLGTWFYLGSLHIPFALQIDQLSLVFTLVITGVGTLIHWYSSAYMEDDDRMVAYFAYLNLFVFFMLVLVLASNYVLLFVGWEGVGLCSYLLIGFWYTNASYAQAAKKAFVVNRIGDLGFLIGLFVLWQIFGALDFVSVLGRAKELSLEHPMLTLATFLLFIGATGKSAQFPLYTWLPDAMAGPTPVSALIHAATMVTAGIYLVARSSSLYVLTPLTLDVMAYVGIATALVAALIACAQTDIKKVLAYSTVSQLGLMVVGLGCAAFGASVFHVVTHAFFKALLFLGAGSVIHALHHQQDIRHMGGLRKHLPTTALTFLVGCIAIAGIPPFAGFFSKDEILAAAYQRSGVLWVLGLCVSLLTSFYMFRLYFLVFAGSFRGTKHEAEHLHEAPPAMALPLLILGALSLLGGFLGFPHVVGETIGIPHALGHYLEAAVASQRLDAFSTPLAASSEVFLMLVATVGALVSCFWAYRTYGKGNNLPKGDSQGIAWWTSFARQTFYIDEIYRRCFTGPLQALANISMRGGEQGFFPMVQKGLVDLTVGVSARGRLIQSGNVGVYILLMVLAIAAFLLPLLRG